ncbi:hypothetical protein M406DRAFT_355367 [Cryphonectria parasitica EP155]|uniref:Uncharacterized protein n=1 Tax=Cryphonectria parasitica (strain ATCC 38755 / EP155) TaxID=660469 RepID=A0A9P5CQT7_CRYP1|nr:uncharacterized protein M406DRAFT_355367 [Cryphonectria parasitica EP155]KAF3766802.1 hypothetical protein M406DRAFT_355367 [Cryphonectria parasitica EP155]
MPSLLIARLMEDDSISWGTHFPRGASGNTSNGDKKRISIIVAVVAALLVLSACIALAAICLSKRRIRKQQLKEARRRDPCLHPRAFSKRRRMTQDDLLHEAEEQREAMIRKSLASRSGRSISQSSQLTVDSLGTSEMTKTGSVYRYGPRDGEDASRQHSRSNSDVSLYDEKSWEAGNHIGRPSSAASLQRARSKSPLPGIPAPTLSRSSSPTRLLQVRSELPPLLEPHPLLRRMNEDSDSENEQLRG